MKKIQAVPLGSVHIVSDFWLVTLKLIQPTLCICPANASPKHSVRYLGEGDRNGSIQLNVLMHVTELLLLAL